MGRCCLVLAAAAMVLAGGRLERRRPGPGPQSPLAELLRGLGLPDVEVVEKTIVDPG